jgi:hypothetical protein
LQECFKQISQSKEPLRSSLLKIMPKFRYNLFQQQVIKYKKMDNINDYKQ